MTDREALDKAQKELDTASYLEETSPCEELKAVYRNKIAWLARVLRLALKAFYDVEKQKPKPKTNADRIRAMSDEELTKNLMEATEQMLNIPFCQNKKECWNDFGNIPVESCMACLFAWLQQPAEVVTHA